MFEVIRTRDLSTHWRPASLTCPPNPRAVWRNVQKPDSIRWRVRRGPGQLCLFQGHDHVGVARYFPFFPFLSLAFLSFATAVSLEQVDSTQSRA
jgi:hypothetical protein